MGWDGPGVALNDWIVIGHSNGGEWLLTLYLPASKAVS